MIVITYLTVDQTTDLAFISMDYVNHPGKTLAPSYTQVKESQ